MEIVSVTPTEVEAQKEIDIWQDSLLFTILAKQQEYTGSFVMMSCQDGDGTTWIEKPKIPLNAIPGYEEDTRNLFMLADHIHMPIIITSGLDLPNFLRNMNDRFPDLQGKVAGLIGSGGNEIWLRDKFPVKSGESEADHWHQDLNHKSSLSSFNRDEVYTLLSGKDYDDNPETINGKLKAKFKDANIRFQPRDLPDNVRSWKIKGATKIEQRPQDEKMSYHFQGTVDTQLAVELYFKELLKSAGREDIKVVTSRDKPLEGGQFNFNIDIVPLTKDEAVHYFSDKVKEAYAKYSRSKEETEVLTFTFGNSGNDIGLIAKGGVIGGFVEGATEEVMRYFNKLRVAKDEFFDLYIIPSQKGEPTLRRIAALKYPAAAGIFAFFQDVERFGLGDENAFITRLVKNKNWKVR
jgi:hypothetical protein